MGGVFRGLVIILAVFGQVAAALAVDLPLSPPVLGFGFTNAFPGLIFDRPVAIASPQGETNRLFVAEKGGRIMVIPDLRNPSALPFLDLSGTTYASVEGGLLGFAFHPQFSQNGRFFVYRLAQPTGFRDELIEFRCDPPSSLQVDPATAKVIFSQRDASDTHNAGDLKFGPDGYLYLSLGDEGPLPPDTHDSPQAIDKGLFGGIIRIDVDFRPGNLAPNPHPAIVNGYLIPKDNPFIGLTNFNGQPVDPGKVRTEFYAVGMRNPWRFTFDPFTENLVAADVGGGVVEEIDIVQKGGNYGWPYMEGSLTNIVEGLPAGLLGPVYEYQHGTGLFAGRVVIGGLVYSGQEFPSLFGKYLFTDYDSGNVWALDLSAPQPSPLWVTASTGIAAFGLHPADGGVLAVNHLLGRIERLAYHDPEQPTNIPRTLSEVGAFQDVATLQPNPEIVPFEVTTPLWSDGALKQRWIDLSHARGQVGFNASNAFAFPAGTVFLKHFELELTNGVPSSRKRIETRVLVKTEEGVYGLTYRWGDSKTNAFLVPPQGTNETFVINDHGILRTQVWAYPTWDQCQACHNKNIGYILGFRSHQLNRDVEIVGTNTNQLAWLAAQGLFSSSSNIVPQQLPHLSALTDPIAPALHRVRSYLESNCIHCHQPGGRAGAMWDARISTPINDAHILGANSLFYPPPMKIIDPGNLTNSYILMRTSNRIPLFQMPPFATAVVDDSFVNLLSTWIPQIPGPDWETADVGAFEADGSLELDGPTFRISSAGKGIAGNNVFLAGRPVFGSTEVSASFSTLISESAAAEAGIMIRQTLDAASPSCALIRKGQTWQFWASTGPGGTQKLITSVPSFIGSRIRLVADGANASAWLAGETLEWRSIGRAELPLGSTYRAGLVAAGCGAASQFVRAEFTDLKISSIALEPPTNNAVTLPAEMSFSARIAVFPTNSAAVQFLANGNSLGTVLSPPWTMQWTNITEGDYALSAALLGAHSSVTSAPVALRADAPEPQIWLKAPDRRTGGNWTNRYGASGFLIPGVTNKESSEATVQALNGTLQVLGLSTNRSALQVDGAGFASVLRAPGPLELLFRSSDYGVHQGELYFRDWLNAGRTQTVTFVDPKTDQVIAQTSVSAQPPAYLPFVFRNQVLVRIANPEGESYVTGIFLDPVPPVGVDLTSVAEGATLTQPVTVQLDVNAVAPGREVIRVEVWDNGGLMQSYTNASLTLTLTNLFPGVHEIKAVAYGSFGTSGQSDPVTVTILPIPSHAQFLATDNHTQGDWKGRYGKDGWWLIGDDQQYPTSVQMTSDGTLFVWADSTADPTALERPYLDDRFASCLFGAPEMSLDLNLRDGQSWVAGIYFLDWGDSHRSLTAIVESLDGTELDRRDVTEFSSGRYLFWRVRGHVRFRFVSQAINSVISGVFLDQILTPYEIWRNQLFTTGEVRMLGSAFDSSDSDGDGFSNALEYFLGYDPRSAADKPLFKYSYSRGWFQINFSQRKQPSDMILLLETSSDLLRWQKIQPVTIVQTGGSENRVSFSIPAPQEGRLFIRYSLSAP